MVRCLIGLGANLGNSGGNLKAATQKMDALEATEVLAVSSYFETKPIGGPPGQSAFLNAAALLETSFGAHELAQRLQGIENDLGRRRSERWGPRQIDLDILLFGETVVETFDLRIPHPWMALRRFVLEPASEIAADCRHPLIGLTVTELLKNLNQTPAVFVVTGLPGVDTTTWASWLASEVPAASTFTFNSLRHASWQLSSGRSVAEAIELLRDWSRPFLRSSLGDDRLSVSDRWCGEILAVCQVVFSRQEYEQVEVFWRQQSHNLIPPKLVVALHGARFQHTQYVKDAPALWNEVWRRVSQPGRGPWLALDENDRERTQHDLLAAVNGMR